ncbi:MAG: hypothetical protein LBJ84_02865, partial [Oscillospiraceae bacterium]|nr:hypothetical protein [Oscillospiraceae bacterium]
MIRYRRRISSRLTMLFCGFALLLCLSIGAFGYVETYRAYVEFYSTKVQHIVRAMAVIVDGDAIKRYADTGETDEYYEYLRETFGEIKSEMDIKYLYIFKPYDDRLMYILEAQTTWDDP